MAQKPAACRPPVLHALRDARPKQAPRGQCRKNPSPARAHPRNRTPFMQQTRGSSRPARSIAAPSPPRATEALMQQGSPPAAPRRVGNAGIDIRIDPARIFATGRCSCARPGGRRPARSIVAPFATPRHGDPHAARRPPAAPRSVGNAGKILRHPAPQEPLCSRAARPLWSMPESIRHPACILATERRSCAKPAATAARRDQCRPLRHPAPRRPLCSKTARPLRRAAARRGCSRKSDGPPQRCKSHRPVAGLFTEKQGRGVPPPVLSVFLYRADVFLQRNVLIANRRGGAHAYIAVSATARS